jgi:hypothetical protein
MDWYLWTLVGFFAYCAIATVAQVGKSRTPIEPGIAAILVIIYAALVAGLLVTR